MRPHRTPFDAYEVHKVAEYADPSGGTYAEPITTPEDRANADDEAVSQYFTVYGHRSLPSGPKAPDLQWVDGSPYSVDGIPVSMAQYHEHAEWYALVTDPTHTEGLGATAIADFPEYEDALDLAYALADGKPVHDYAEGME